MGLMGIGLAAKEFYDEEREAKREEERRKTAFEQQKELIDYRAGIAATQAARAEQRKERRDVEAFLASNGLEDTPENRRLAASAVRSYGLKEANVLLAKGDLNIAGSAPMAIAPDELGAMLTKVNTQYDLPEGYLYTTAGIESGFDPNAQNPNSSAGGLFQQLDGNAQQYGVTNRFDPMESALGAAKFAKDNARVLRNRLGRDPNAAELYLAHQQGAGGASALLSSPNENVLDVMTRVHNGNRRKAREAIELNGGDPSMTAGEFANLWINKYNSRASVFSPDATVLPSGPAPAGFDLSQSTDNEMSDLFSASPGLSFSDQEQEQDPAEMMSADGLDTGVFEDRTAQLPTIETPDTRRLELNVGQDIDIDELSGLSMEELQRRRALLTDPDEIALYDRAIEAAGQFSVEDKNLPGLGKDPEVYMDWLIQNPNADPETVTVVEKQLARAQQEAGTQMPELTDQKFSIDVEAPDGAADTVEAVLGEDGKFYQLGQNGWQPVAGNIVASRSYDSIGLGSQVTARVQKIDTEFNQKRNAFTDMVTQASGLAGIVNRNEDVLRTAGGPLASFVSKIDGNIEAFINNLSTEDGPVTRNDVETLISSFESDLATSSMSRTARDYAEFKARQLRFAYAFARVTNEQSGVGLSNADLRNAYDTISSGSSRENYLNSLSNQIELSQTSLETAFKTYNENQAIRNARALPGIDMSPSDFDAYMSDLRSSVDLSWMEQTAGPDQTQETQTSDQTEFSFSERTPTQAAITELLKNPEDLRDRFDEAFGQGAADYIIQQNGGL